MFNTNFSSSVNAQVKVVEMLVIGNDWTVSPVVAKVVVARFVPASKVGEFVHYYAHNDMTVAVRNVAPISKAVVAEFKRKGQEMAAFKAQDKSVRGAFTQQDKERALRWFNYHTERIETQAFVETSWLIVGSSWEKDAEIRTALSAWENTAPCVYTESLVGNDYDAVYVQDKNGAWSARVPSCPGCVSQGNTLEDARSMIRDAFCLWQDAACVADAENVDAY